MMTIYRIRMSQEKYDDRAGEGPIIDNDVYNGDGQSVSSSSDAGESDEVSSVVDLDPELQAIKGSPVEKQGQHPQDPDSRVF